MSTQNKQTVHSGATLTLKINGIEIGRAQGLDARRSFGTEGVYEIGSIMPQEHINNRYEGSATLDRFFVRKQTLREIGLAALGSEVLLTDIIDIELCDNATGEAIRVYRGCTISDYSENVRTGQIAGENVSFQYLSCDDNINLYADNPQLTRDRSQIAV